MAVAELEHDSLASVEEENYWGIIWMRFRKHKLAVTGMVVIIVIILACALANWVAPYGPTDINKDENGQIYRNAPPSFQFFMGTDSIGRDVFSRLLFAGQISLAVAFVVTIIAETFGSFIGAVSGYFGGKLDDIIQRIVEFMITLPLLPMLLAFSAILRGMSIPGLPDEWSSAVIIAVILIAFGWTQASRLMRGMVLSLRNQDFADASVLWG